MSKLVDTLRQVGSLHASGEFTLDMQQADAKMSRFQFAQEQDFLFQMVGGLFRLGARQVDVTYANDLLTLSIDRVTVPDVYPKELAAQVLEEFSPWRRLAAAYQAILAHGPTGFEWRGKDKKSYDCLTGQALHWQRVQLEEIRILGLPAALVQQALSELRRRAVYHRLRLTVQGSELPGLADALARVGDKYGFFSCDPTRPSQLLLVVDEMTSDPKPLVTEIPWQGVVYWEQPVCMDASLAAVVEDEAYAALRGAVPETFARCLLDLRPLCGRGDVRRFLLDLMRPPAPLWLHQIYGELLRLELFKDHQERAWSLLSLQQHCLATGEPVYYSEGAPPAGLTEVILREQSPSALDCLAIHLPGQLQEATPLVVRQLQRRANLKLWQARPATGLQLPLQNWIARRECDDLVIGVCDDWCLPGGTISLVHLGKLLGQRSLPHPEVAFGVVCEIEPERISELWDGIDELSWGPLSTRILGQLDELLSEMVAHPDSLGPLRRHLLDHLAASDCPQDSYFASTLLFLDWKGQPHSLFSLLKAKGEGFLVGLVAPDRLPPEAPPEFLPKAVFVQDGMAEGRCLTKVKELSVRDFDAWLADLDEAIASPPPADLDSPYTVSWEGKDYRAQLRLNPLWDQAEVHVCVEGIPIETHTLECELGFTAIVHSDSFKLQIRTGNKRLGLKRYALADNAPWRHCQQDLLRQAEVSLGLRVESLAKLPRPWPAWALNAVLRGFAVKFSQLADFVSFSAFPQDISLAAMLAAPSILWSSQKPDEAALKEFVAQHPDVSLVAPLFVVRQQLLEAAYGGNWTCVDEWFVRNERQREFLKRPVKPLGHPKALVTAPAQEPLSGMLLLLDDVSQAGLIAWHHQQRPLMEEPLSSCPALLAQVECDQLQPDGDFTSLVPAQTLAQLKPLVVQQLTDLVVTWLATPRPAHPHFYRIWTEWQGLSPEVAQSLKRQPWIATNQGYRSWDELMEVATLYRLPSQPEQDFPDLTILIEDRCLMGILYRLVATHPQCVSVQDSQLFMADRVRWQKQQANLRSHSERLARYDYKARLRPPNQGEIVLLGEARKECWLVLSEQALLVHNLPAGLGGYLQCDDHTLLPASGAELGFLARQQLLLDALPLFVLRIMAGNLSPLEQDLVAEFCLHALPANPDEEPWNQLMQARWLPCADGTRTSLHQLQLLAEEQGALLYWEKAYRFANHSALIPLLNSPLLLEVVRRCCGVQPTLRPKPLLLRDLGDVVKPGLSRLRQLIEGLGQWVAARPGARLAQGVGEMIEQQSAPAGGSALVAALGRLARLMLQGVARSETLSCLDRLVWCTDAQPAALWSLTPEGGLTLYAQHPRLRPWLGQTEPPAPVTLSLLLGLVSLVNARSQAFSDDMEREFLEHLVGELVSSYRDLMP